MKKLLMVLFFLITLNALTLPKNFQSDFVQTITDKDNKIIYKGKIFYKNGKLLWHYTYPVDKYIWILDKVYIYEPDLYQVTITRKPKFNLENIIKNAKKVNNNLYETKINDILVKFKYNNFLKELKYKNKMDNLVDIKFFNQKIIPIKDSIFKPNYPKDVDIIYQR